MNYQHRRGRERAPLESSQAPTENPGQDFRVLFAGSIGPIRLSVPIGQKKGRGFFTNLRILILLSSSIYARGCLRIATVESFGTVVGLAKKRENP